MESEIVGNKAKVRTVSKLSEEDARSISNLNDERNRKQAILQENQAILQIAMEENNTITSQITALENELEQCVANERGQKDLLKQLKNRRTELTHEYEELGTQIPQLQDSNNAASEKLEQKDSEIADSLVELRRIDEMLEAKQKEGQQEQQRLMDLERDRENTRTRLKDTVQRVKERSNDLNQQQETTRQIEKRLREQKWRFEGAKSEKQEVDDRCTKAQKDLVTLNQSIASIEAGIAEAKKEIDERNTLVEKLKKQNEAQEIARNKIIQKQNSVQESFEAIRKDCDTIRNTIDATELEIEQLRREGEFLRKQIDATAREQNSKIKKKEGEVQKQSAAETLLELYKNQSHNIDCEISIVKDHIQQTQQQIFSVETDREHYSEELSTATSQYLHAQDILKDIDNKVNAKNKEIAAADRRVRQQQTLYEQVRGEREIASKKVKEVQAEIEQLKHGFERMKFAIEQHKDDIRRKDKERIKDRRDLDMVNLEDSRLREKLTEVQIDGNTAQRAIIAHEGELSKLDQTIKDAEAQLKMDEQKLAEVKKERDHMSNQNVAREKELKAINEKLNVIRNQCKRGEHDYDVKETEISIIRSQLARDQERLDELSKIDIEMKEKREQIHNMQKELMTLKAERTAMEEELKIPINIHRWTLLESSDPVRFEKLKRYQELQADLVARTKEVSDLQDLIKEKENEYQELCAQLRRKPGIEVEQKVAEYRGKQKSEKFSLDQITSQLEMYRDAVKEYRKELSDVQQELTSERNKWIRQKKRDIKNRQMFQEVMGMQQAELSRLGVHIDLSET
ncbi:hypothetical protein TRFO_04796 [Tritrichomonas foetus]|uniref:Cilia- and flagella-associated protein 58 central coiled coil domain-containing protein n=1 Tax=Tritrichomonas foetus TaxID=1144522 RepID=A0A1J4KCL1_9EUKA|nr:hypothetical protein TRFO_04796 [Tritrichomonas foetus]|eukprot:OHT08714.1 hypothetical protein TRFO_04796 [Tritrichomonas foetus]